MKVVVGLEMVCVRMRTLEVESANVARAVVMDWEVVPLEPVSLEELERDECDEEVVVVVVVELVVSEEQDDEVVVVSQEQGAPSSLIEMTTVSTRRLLAIKGPANLL